MSARLALIGAPGSGKSAVAADLGARWGCPVIDTDEEYERARGVAVGAAVIDDEAAFRDEEEAITLAALEVAGAVVAVGSGAVTSEPVQRALASVPTAWLRVGSAHAARRTGLSGMRPVALGNVRGQLHDMLEQRGKVYGSLADHVVDTDGRSAVVVADDIEEWEAR